MTIITDSTTVMYLLITISLLLAMVASMLWYKQKATKAYWHGRTEGWKACEDLVYNRLKQCYPEKAQDIWCNLLQ